VLLVVESATGLSPLLQRLEDFGCQCQLAASCLDAAQRITQTSFDVVLCGDQTKNFPSLLNAVRSSSASLFRYLLVEDGCWWVRAICQGEPCSDAPAFRDREFSEALDQMSKSVG
jgi:CheY-like chemotaxis protein